MEIKELSSEQKIKIELKKLDRYAWYIGLVGMIVMFVFTILATQFHIWFDFTNTGQIGDTIGGLTTPIIGIFSALLIYFSFRAQIKANYIVQSQIEKQEISEKEKKEIEFINNLMLQFREEINEFTCMKYEGPIENGHNVLYRGADGLKTYLSLICSASEYYNEHDMEFFNNQLNQQYLGLLDILDKLIQIIKESNLKVSDKEYFKSQIRYLFDYKLTLSPSQEIYPCGVCGENHILLPCILHKRISIIDVKIDFLEHLEN